MKILGAYKGRQGLPDELDGDSIWISIFFEQEETSLCRPERERGALSLYVAMQEPRRIPPTQNWEEKRKFSFVWNGGHIHVYTHICDAILYFSLKRTRKTVYDNKMTESEGEGGGGRGGVFCCVLLCLTHTTTHTTHTTLPLFFTTTHNTKEGYHLCNGVRCCFLHTHT